MRQLIVRVRPAEVMEDIDLDVIRERAARLRGWDVDVRDSRVSDAPFVTLVARTREITDAAAEEIRRELADLPRMRALVWRRHGNELELPTATSAVLQDASEEVQP